MFKGNFLNLSYFSILVVQCVAFFFIYINLDPMGFKFANPLAFDIFIFESMLASGELNGLVKLVTFSVWLLFLVATVVASGFFFSKKNYSTKFRNSIVTSFNIFNNFVYLFFVFFFFYFFLTFFNLSGLPYTYTFDSFSFMRLTIVYCTSLVFPYLVVWSLSPSNTTNFFFEIKENKLFVFYFIIFTYFAAFIFTVFSTTFLNFFVAVELQSFSFIILFSFFKTRVHYSILISYIVQMIVCAAMMLLGVAMIYNGYRTLDFHTLAALNSNFTRDAIGSNSYFGSSYAYVILGLFTFLFGVAGKAGAFPFFRWPFDLYAVLPTPLVFMSSTLTKMAVLVPTFFIMKVAFYPFITVYSFSAALTFLAVLSLLFGSVYGLFVKDLRSLVAASSIIQTGFIYLLLLSPAYVGDAFASYYLLGYFFVLIILFHFLNLEKKVLFESKDSNNTFSLNLDLTKAQESTTIENKIEKTSGVYYSGMTAAKNFFLLLTIWGTFLALSGFPPFPFFYAKVSFLSNVYFYIEIYNASFSNFVFVIFVIASTLNMIMYSKFIFKHLFNENREFKLNSRFSREFQTQMYIYLSILIYLTFMINAFIF